MGLPQILNVNNFFAIANIKKLKMTFSLNFDEKNMISCLCFDHRVPATDGL